MLEFKPNISMTPREHEQALSQARADGEREGLERAVAWHEEQAAGLRSENDRVMREGISIDAWRLNIAERHIADAQAIRALIKVPKAAARAIADMPIDSGETGLSAAGSP